jgi:amino acid permease
MNMSNFDRKLLAYIMIPVAVLAVLAIIRACETDDVRMFILALGFDAIEFIICAYLIKKSGGKVFKGGRHKLFVVIIIVVKAEIGRASCRERV